MFDTSVGISSFHEADELDNSTEAIFAIAGAADFRAAANGEARHRTKACLI